MYVADSGATDALTDAASGERESKPEFKGRPCAGKQNRDGFSPACPNSASVLLTAPWRGLCRQETSPHLPDVVVLYGGCATIVPLTARSHSCPLRDGRRSAHRARPGSPQEIPILCSHKRHSVKGHLKSPENASKFLAPATLVGPRRSDALARCHVRPVEDFRCRVPTRQVTLVVQWRLHHRLASQRRQGPPLRQRSKSHVLLQQPSRTMTWLLCFRL